jgi:hypothetical protein
MTNSDFPWFESIIVALIVPLIGLIWHGVKKYLHNRRLKHSNPFTNLSQIRKNEIRRIVRQIMTGQSSAIIGAFEKEKTDILNVLDNPKLYGDKGDSLIFSKNVEISSLDTSCDKEQFWKQALKPLKFEIKKQQGHFFSRRKISALSKAYKDCQDNKFDEIFLQRLFDQLKKNKQQFILLIDRFDLLLQRENLKQAKFFGGLRKMASPSNSSLNLVITLNISLRQFHQESEALNPGGSPYLNFMDDSQITLGVLSETEIDNFLQQSQRKLNDDDCLFIKKMAGGHPHLLKIATTSLWDTDDNESAEKEFHKKIKGLLNEIIRIWPESTCKAFLSVVQKREVSSFIEELEELEEQGFIVKENEAWQIRPSVFSSLLADKAAQKCG